MEKCTGLILRPSLPNRERYFRWGHRNSHSIKPTPSCSWSLRLSSLMLSLMLLINFAVDQVHRCRIANTQTFRFLLLLIILFKRLLWHHFLPSTVLSWKLEASGIEDFSFKTQIFPRVGSAWKAKPTPIDSYTPQKFFGSLAPPAGDYSSLLLPLSLEVNGSIHWTLSVDNNIEWQAAFLTSNPGPNFEVIINFLD